MELGGVADACHGRFDDGGTSYAELGGHHRRFHGRTTRNGHAGVDHGGVAAFVHCRQRDDNRRVVGYLLDTLGGSGVLSHQYVRVAVKYGVSYLRYLIPAVVDGLRRQN